MFTQKVFSLNSGFRICFVFTGDGLSLHLDFMKILGTPEESLYNTMFLGVFRSNEDLEEIWGGGIY